MTSSGGDESATKGELRRAALEAEKRGDVGQALDHWAALRAAAPDNALGYSAALRLLRQRKRFDEAAVLLKTALERFPEDVDVLVVGARLAEQAKQADEADHLWQRVVALRPGDREYSLGAAMALSRIKKGRHINLPKALERLDDHHLRFPDDVEGYCGHVDALRMAKDIMRLRKSYQGADALSAAWCARFPDSEALALARVALLEEQGKLDEAWAELRTLRDRKPASPAIEAASIHVLSCSGRTEDAEAAYVEAIARFPGTRKIMVEHARIASRNDDWREAEHRLLAVQAQLPGDLQIAHELRVARQMLLGADDASAGGADETAAPHAVPEAPIDAVAALMAGFESLGGTGMGCEFGMVQRQLGSDGLSLLRWAETDPDRMIAALSCEFEGVGDEANTELRTVRQGLIEQYSSRDRRFLMRSHTFVNTADVPADRMFTQTCRRLRFLRGRLLEDLRLAEKIFVYRAQEPVGDATLREIHDRLVRYGDNALLCVMLADQANPPGTLRTVARGLFAGYVGYFRNLSATGGGSDVESWIAACTKAHAAWQSARTGHKAA